MQKYNNKFIYTNFNVQNDTIRVSIRFVFPDAQGVLAEDWLAWNVRLGNCLLFRWLWGGF